MRWIGLFAVVTVLTATCDAIAGDGCCAQCGCQASCQKVCRLVCIDKKVEITCYGCKCEDFCLPTHSKKDCEHCETVCESCEECDKSGVYAKGKPFLWNEWIPGCARIHTKKKLMKKTITKTVPSYKWVVEDVCSKCQSKAASVDVPQGVQIPPAPVVDAKLR